MIHTARAAALPLIALLLVACAAAAPHTPPRADSRAPTTRATERPDPIFTHNLSLEKRWVAERPRDHLPLLEDIVAKARDAGYRRVMLARPLPHDQWNHRKGAEPLEQLHILSTSRRDAITRIVRRHPDIEFSTHLGYERLVGDPASLRRQSAAWSNPDYRRALEAEIRDWNDLGYFVWLEGVGGPKPEGRQWFENKPDDLRVGGIVWPMDPNARLVRSDQSPMIGELRFLENKLRAGLAEPNLVPTGATRYVAISQQTADHIIQNGRTDPSPLLESLLEHPTVGLVCLNTGRKDQRLHERVMQLHRRLTRRE